MNLAVASWFGVPALAGRARGRLKPGLQTRNHILAVLATFVLAVLLVTDAAESPARRVFRAGAATSNITPPLGTSMAGSFWEAKATHIHDEQLVRCLALDDGTTKLVFAIVDACLIERGVFDDAKRQVREATGLPMEHMTMAATHSHSCGTLTSVHQSMADPAYQRFAARRIADGVIRALNNLVPARIAWGLGEVSGQAFNRRWKMKPGTPLPNPFGGFDKVQTNPGSVINPGGGKSSGLAPNPNLLEPAGPTDPQVWFISVRATDGRPVALLANYSLHYVGGTRAGEISADYFGMFADRIQQLLGADRLDPPFVGILSNGASGDINNIDYRKPRTIHPPYARMKTVADEVAREVARVEKTLEYRDWVPLSVAQKDITLPLRLPTKAEVEKAREVVKAVKTYPRMVTVEEKYARETVTLADFPPRVSAPLQVVKIGDLRVWAIPAEVFCEIGLELKRWHPTSFVLALANGYHGYLPTPTQHALGGYETWRAISSCLEVDASTKIVAGLGELLAR